jgi:hypothetical protein
MTSYTLLIIHRTGHTTFLKSLEIIPGGFGTGIALASTFISLTSKISSADMAVATLGLYLSTNIGMVLGVSVGSSVQKGVLKGLLIERLQAPNELKIIERVLSDVSYVRNLEGALRKVVVGSYVESLKYSHGKIYFASFFQYIDLFSNPLISLPFSIIYLFLQPMKNRKIDGKNC